MNMHSLTIGITTFNRRPLLQTMAAALAQVRHLDSARILVLDDCSQEFDVDALRQLFPGADVHRAAEHSGAADYAMHRLFERFVRTGSGYLLVLDSDLLSSRNLVDRCGRIIEADRINAQPCLYSVFNTASHRTLRVEGSFAIKHTVGAAGTLWRHSLLADVL
jgi:GT2 family glycosyltransferase